MFRQMLMLQNFGGANQCNFPNLPKFSTTKIYNISYLICYTTMATQYIYVFTVYSYVHIESIWLLAMHPHNYPNCNIHAVYKQMSWLLDPSTIVHKYLTCLL